MQASSRTIQSQGKDFRSNIKISALTFILGLIVNFSVFACAPLDNSLNWKVRLESALQNNDLVFIAHIEKISRVNLDRRHFTFTALNSVKGNPSFLKYIETGMGDGGGDCSPSIDENKTFLLLVNTEGVLKSAWEFNYPPAIGAVDNEYLLFLKQYASP